MCFCLFLLKVRPIESFKTSSVEKILLGTFNCLWEYLDVHICYLRLVLNQLRYRNFQYPLVD